MIEFLKASDVPKKTPSDKFVSLPPANRKIPSRQKPFKQKTKKPKASKQ